MGQVATVNPSQGGGNLAVHSTKPQSWKPHFCRTDPAGCSFECIFQFEEEQWCGAEHPPQPEAEGTQWNRTPSVRHAVTMTKKDLFYFTALPKLG